MRPTPFTILMIDDDLEDQAIMQRAWRCTGNTNPIQAVRDGEEAIAYLTGEGEYSDRSRFPYPAFITLDLKMARGDGLSVLEHLKSRPEWAVIPTAVLTGSTDTDDIKKVYMLGASSYHVKPSTFEGLAGLLKILLDYWMTCEVPRVDVTGKQLKTDSSGKLGERFPQGE